MPHPPACPSCGRPRPAGAADCPRCDPVPVAEVAPDLAAPLSDAAREIARGHRLGAMTDAQRAVYALLARGLAEVRPRPVHTVLAFLFVPVMTAVGVGLGLGGMGLAAAVVGAAGDGGWVLYAAPLGLLYLVKLTVEVMKAGAVGLELDRGRADRFRLGRLNDVFSAGAPGTLGLFFGVAFGAFWGLLVWSPGQGGVGAAGGVWSCFLLAADNVLHGVLLDAAELYDLRVGDKVTHTTASATVFGIARLAFDGLALLFAWEVYQRVGLRRFYNGFPDDPRRPDDLLAWLDRTCGDRGDWPRRFADEFLFLVAARAFVRGRYEVVRGLTADLGWARVAPEVRALFRDPAGAGLFAPARD
jgi:hypothetical protein